MPDYKYTKEELDTIHQVRDALGMFAKEELPAKKDAAKAFQTETNELKRRAKELKIQISKLEKDPKFMNERETRLTQAKTRIKNLNLAIQKTRDTINRQTLNKSRTVKDSTIELWHSNLKKQILLPETVTRCIQQTETEITNMKNAIDLILADIKNQIKLLKSQSIDPMSDKKFVETMLEFQKKIAVLETYENRLPKLQKLFNTAKNSNGQIIWKNTSQEQTSALEKSLTELLSSTSKLISAVETKEQKSLKTLEAENSVRQDEVDGLNAILALDKLTSLQENFAVLTKYSEETSEQRALRKRLSAATYNPALKHQKTLHEKVSESVLQYMRHLLQKQGLFDDALTEVLASAISYNIGQLEQVEGVDKANQHAQCERMGWLFKEDMPPIHNNLPLETMLLLQEYTYDAYVQIGEQLSENRVLQMAEWDNEIQAEVNQKKVAAELAAKQQAALAQQSTLEAAKLNLIHYANLPIATDKQPEWGTVFDALVSAPELTGRLAEAESQLKQAPSESSEFTQPPESQQYSEKLLTQFKKDSLKQKMPNTDKGENADKPLSNKADKPEPPPL